MKTMAIFLSLTWSLQSIVLWTCPLPALLVSASPRLPGFPPKSLALPAQPHSLSSLMFSHLNIFFLSLLLFLSVVSYLSFILSSLMALNFFLSFFFFFFFLITKTCSLFEERILTMHFSAYRWQGSYPLSTYWSYSLQKPISGSYLKPLNRKRELLNIETFVDCPT